MTRSPIRRRFLVCALWSAAASTAAGAAAQANRTRARLTVDAATGCATEAAIIERVRERSHAITFAQHGGPSLRAAVVAEPDGKVAAQLSLHADGRRSERRLAANSCKEAIEALALLIVLALDPSTEGAPPRDSSSPRDYTSARLSSSQRSPATMRVVASIALRSSAVFGSNLLKKVG